MKQIINVVILGVVSLMLAAPMAGSQSLDRVGRGYDTDYDNLGLTRDQMDKIGQLEKEYDEEMNPLLDQLDGYYRELDNFRMQRTPDQKQIDQSWRRIEELENKLADRENVFMDRYRRILTEEQLRILDYGPADTAYGYGRGVGRIGAGRGFASGYGQGAGLGRALPGRSFASGYGRGAGLGRARGGAGAFGAGIGRLGGGRAGLGRSYGGRLYDVPQVGRGAGLGYGVGAYPWNRYSAGVGGYSAYPRYGRGPCGAGLGRYDRRGAGRGWLRRW